MYAGKGIKDLQGKWEKLYTCPTNHHTGKWLRPLGFFVGDKITVTQEGNRLIVEKCKDGYDAEEEAAMAAEPVRRYAEPLGRCGRWS